MIQDMKQNGVKTFSPVELEEALYNATDILDRCMLPYVLLRETARDVNAGPEVLHEADGVYIGIEERYMTPEVWSNIGTFSRNVDLHYGMTDYVRTNNGFGWKHNGVPIIVQIIERDYKMIHNPDIKLFRLESYRIPNPFDKYWKARWIIR